MSQREGLTYRTVSGWISDFSSIPRWEPWPSIALDRRLMDDLNATFEAAQAVAYTDIVLWGLLCGRSWSSYLPDTVDKARRERVMEIMAAARRRGLRVLMGLGLYSWGFDEIIVHHPQLDGGFANIMCGSCPESHVWMEKVIDYVMEYDPDGLSLQSSDQGRCLCDLCRELDALEYHAMLNDRVASYVRSRWPDKVIEISTWGMDLGNPDNIAHVQQMTAHVDILNDFNNSSSRQDPANRRRLVAALSCAFGTEAGWWVDPPPFWDRLKWFLPFSVRNVPYFRDLVADGGHAVQRYILPLANPGAEVGFIFDGLMLGDVQRDPLDTLGEALDMVFEPRTVAARDGLIEIWRGVEDGYLDNAHLGAASQPVGLSRVHYSGRVPPVKLAERPEYLLRMKPKGLGNYAHSLRVALDTVRKIRVDLNNGDKATRLETNVGWALSEAELVQALRACYHSM